MSIRSLKQRADKLASDADGLRLERNRSTARCLAVLRRRVASPVGLAVCFGAGLLAGSHSHSGRRNGAAHERETDHSDRESLALQTLRGPLGATAIRLASAFVAGAVMRPDGPASGTVADRP